MSSEDEGKIFHFLPSTTITLTVDFLIILMLLISQSLRLIKTNKYDGYPCMADHSLPVVVCLSTRLEKCFPKAKVVTDFWKAIPFLVITRLVDSMPPAVPRESGKYMKESVKSMER